MRREWFHNPLERLLQDEQSVSVLQRHWTNPKREEEGSTMRFVTSLFTPTKPMPHSSGIYDAEWANKLYRGCKRNTSDPDNFSFAVVTDFPPEDFDQGIEVFPYKYAARNWTSNMERYRPDVVGKEAILLDLDTLIIGSLEPVEKACKGVGCVALLDPYNAPETICTAAYVNAEVAEELWGLWVKEKDSIIDNPKYFMWGFFSEMKWLRENQKYDRLWDIECPKVIQSWKVNLDRKDPGEGVAVVYWHGQEKPTGLLYKEWVRDNWK